MKKNVIYIVLIFSVLTNIVVAFYLFQNFDEQISEESKSSALVDDEKR